MDDVVTALPRYGISPVQLAFLGSLLLSLIAVAGTVTLAKDAARYLYVSQQIVEQGPRVAFELFSWPWFSLLLAGTQRLSGISLELVGLPVVRFADGGNLRPAGSDHATLRDRQRLLGLPGGVVDSGLQPPALRHHPGVRILVFLHPGTVAGAALAGACRLAARAATATGHSCRGAVSHRGGSPVSGAGACACWPI
jgi:hypothetical protein